MGISPISKFSKLCANRMGDVTRMNLCILTTSDCAFAFFHVISNEHCQPTAVFITFHPVSSVKISTNRNFVSWKFRQMVRRKIEKFLRTDEFCLSLAIASTPDSNWNSFLYFRHGNCYFPVESDHFLRNMFVSFLYLFFNFLMARVINVREVFCSAYVFHFGLRAARILQHDESLQSGKTKVVGSVCAVRMRHSGRDRQVCGSNLFC